jgi:hypothetical protein
MPLGQTERICISSLLVFNLVSALSFIVGLLVARRPHKIVRRALLYHLAHAVAALCAAVFLVMAACFTSFTALALLGVALTFYLFGAGFKR